MLCSVETEQRKLILSFLANLSLRFIEIFQRCLLCFWNLYLPLPFALSLSLAHRESLLLTHPSLFYYAVFLAYSRFPLFFSQFFSGFVVSPTISMAMYQHFFRMYHSGISFCSMLTYCLRQQQKPTYCDQRKKPIKNVVQVQLIAQLGIKVPDKHSSHRKPYSRDFSVMTVVSSIKFSLFFVAWCCLSLWSLLVERAHSRVK